jgi:predicted short-subunit dehydrogenase-like oxidoreductase (DUF2520 family)
MRIVFIGAGRLATNLAPALCNAGHQVVQVYSRTLTSAKALAEKVGAEAVADLAAVTVSADVFVFSVTDAVLAQLAMRLGKGREETVFLHTAGSVPLSVFDNVVRHYGVLYPMQSFSKERRVDFVHVPVFIESNDDVASDVVTSLATALSSQVMTLDTEARRHLHLAAVFACNFVNHCYQLSSEILEKYHLPFEVMLPLIDETAAKVHSLMPIDAQTGPAIRYDQNVMQAQLQLLNDQPRLAQVYELMSQSIHQSYLQKNDKL